MRDSELASRLSLAKTSNEHRQHATDFVCQAECTCDFGLWQQVITHCHRKLCFYLSERALGVGEVVDEITEVNTTLPLGDVRRYRAGCPRKLRGEIGRVIAREQSYEPTGLIIQLHGTLPNPKVAVTLNH
jgi:hypothetical protein